MKITWGKVSGADKYRVYRKTSKSDWKYIASTKNRYFTDKTAVSGKTYTYTVKGVASTNGGAFNAKGIKETYLSMPKLGTVTFNEKNYAKALYGNRM